MLSKEQPLMFEHVLFFCTEMDRILTNGLTPQKKKWSLTMFHYHVQVHLGNIWHYHLLILIGWY